MRVTHVITRLIVGGAQENTVASVLALRRKPGMQVDLIAGPTCGPEGNLKHLFDAEPGVLTLLPQLVRRISPWSDWIALQALARIFRRSQPDIVHTHSGKAGVLGRLAAARAGVPVILHTIHGPSFGVFQGPFLNLVLRAAERRAAQVTTHFVVVCEAMKQQYLAAGIGQPAQYSTILSGFDLQPFLETSNDQRLRSELGIGADDLVIGKVARLFKLKGHDDLFEVAPDLVRACPRIKFLLVGDGPWRGRFESKARALRIQDRFVFTGLVPPEKVASLMGIMDVLVHLSLREGLARALPQALAAARPVVAYDADGACEVCRDQETGFLVRPGDRETLRNRVLELANAPDLRTRLGRQGREYVRHRFGVEQMVEELYSLYDRLQTQHLRRGTPPLSTHRMAC
jgi:glycosyltransferase involved in cell wall biosynthesis